MKNSRKEPTFLLEVPQLICHLIMKRGHMLRSGRTRTLVCVGKGGPKSWLEAKLIPSAGESTDENWDKAHELAAKFKRELHSDVYVEPACEHGRFKAMTSPELPSSEFSDPEDFFATGIGKDFGMGADFGPSLAPGLRGAVGNGFGFGHNSGQSDPFGMETGTANFPGMPHIPDPMKDLLPQQVRQAMGMVGASSDTSAKTMRAELSFPALGSLPGWAELPESKRTMYEVEAAQLRSSEQTEADSVEVIGMPASPLDDVLTGEKALAVLTVNPRISAALKRFLLESFEAATAQQGSANSI